MKLNLLRASCLSLVIICISAISSNAQSVLPAYKYKVTAYKKGNNAITSESNTAEVLPPLSLYIPNAFSPNGDGVNDNFGISGSAIGEFTFQIFSRWGEIIFETNDPVSRWDGTYKGDDVPIGAYVYKVMAKGIEGGVATKSGSVTLIR